MSLDHLVFVFCLTFFGRGSGGPLNTVPFSSIPAAASWVIHYTLYILELLDSSVVGHLDCFYVLTICNNTDNYTK